MTPRGIVNNNPGNIRRSSIVWRGMAEIQTDPSFVQFEKPEWGFRAMARIIRTHYVAGAQSIKAQIEGIPDGSAFKDAWAPAVENDTGAYVTDVAKRCSVTPDAILVIPDDFFNLLSAICWHENGQMPYDAAVIQKGIQLESA